jgi:hypothetical protein
VGHTEAATKSIKTILDRICNISVETYYNPHEMFNWPDSLSDDQWWMSPELMSVAGTEYEGRLDEQQLKALSKWESIHFYSMNVHGIRELLIDVVKRVQMPNFELESEYFHHFIGEENDHLWFFATFCNKYGKKIYPDRKTPFHVDNPDPATENFMVFSQILIFEEVIDYFNKKMAKDESLHEIVRQINAFHHQDESRHIAFGREVVKLYYGEMCESASPERVEEMRTFVKRYMISSMEALYNPAVYKDAGLPEPYEIRRNLLANPICQERNRTFLKRTVDFFVNNGILADRDFLQ